MTAPTPPAVPDDTTDPTWLDEAVEAGKAALWLSDAMTGNDEGTPSMYYVDPENLGYLVNVALTAALPAITGGIADAVEVELEEDSVDPGYDCGIENAAIIVRNFGSEVG